MPETIFIKMVNDEGKVRDSYTDYWTLINLSGYKTCALSEMDFASDNVYIFSPDDGNSKAHFTQDKAKDRKCKVVLLQLEWPTWKDGVLSGHEVPDYVDEMWICDVAYFVFQKMHNPNRHKIQEFFLGGHPNFGNHDYANNKVIWDFCHLSYVYGMREHKMRILADRGFTFGPNAWGEEREKVLRSCRWGLHLHQRPLPWLAPQRFLLFASYGLPIITDPLDYSDPYKVFQDGLIHFDPRETSVMNDAIRRDAVEHNFHLVREERPFKNEVDEGVAILLENSNA